MTEPRRTSGPPSADLEALLRDHAHPASMVSGVVTAQSPVFAGLR